MKLSELPQGSEVFVDANIFLYHFHAASQECRAFVRACERGEFRPLSSAETLVEVAHRAMLAEAIRKGLATPKTVVRELKQRPELLAGLTEYRTLLRQVRAFLASVVPATAQLLERALDLAPALQLLTRDSMLVAALETTSTKRLATADRDFARLPGIEVYSPSDVHFVGV